MLPFWTVSDGIQKATILDCFRWHSKSCCFGLFQMAFKKLQAAKNTLQNPDVGQRVKDEGKRAFAEWKAQHEQALDVIQELYITYFSQTMEVYKGLSPVRWVGVIDKQTLYIICIYGDHETLFLLTCYCFSPPVNLPTLSDPVTKGSFH